MASEVQVDNIIEDSPAPAPEMQAAELAVEVDVVPAAEEATTETQETVDSLEKNMDSTEVEQTNVPERPASAKSRPSSAKPSSRPGSAVSKQGSRPASAGFRVIAPPPEENVDATADSPTDREAEEEVMDAQEHVHTPTEDPVDEPAEATEASEAAEEEGNGDQEEGGQPLETDALADEQYTNEESLDAVPLVEEQHGSEEDRIVERCIQAGGLFDDPDFPASVQSLYKSLERLPEYATQEPTINRWLRPHEISDEPQLFIEGSTAGDVMQGSLGDCFLLGALSAVATRKELIEQLFVSTVNISTVGVLTCRFFKNGSWKEIVIDTRIPYSHTSERLSAVYGHCSNMNEMWVPLIEKAYAKLHGSYEAINGGSELEALVDLTGGASEKWNMREESTIELVTSGRFWWMMKRYVDLGYMLGCAFTVEDGPAEEEEPDGILTNHAYGVLDVREVNGLCLVLIRNPWGYKEWKGAFSDGDEQWDKHPGLKRELGYEFKDDGTWWMTFEDWCGAFNNLYVCKLFPSSWQQVQFDGRWEGKTFGGSARLQADVEPEGEKVKMDTDSRWFNNPQYRITVTKQTEVVVSLMQEDSKMSGISYLPVNFTILKVKDRKSRVWEKEKEDVVCEGSDLSYQRLPQREITRTVTLDPISATKPAHYVIIPNVETERLVTDGRNFILRIFSSNPVEPEEICSTYEVSFQGQWTPATAGGKRTKKTGSDNAMWCQNPQYFVGIKKPTHLKVVVRRLVSKRAKGTYIGLCVTKAERGSGSDKLTKLSPKKRQAIRSGLLDASMLINQDVKPVRKLQVRANEWVVESSYISEEVAALYFQLKPEDGPLVIVPSLSDSNVTGGYTLSFYSDTEISAQQLEDSHNAVITGSWDDETAGGCHLYSKQFEVQAKKLTWATNPKFLLTLLTDGPSAVRLTLSRPEKVWKKQTSKDTVGCMLGFYIFKGGNIDRHNVVVESAFVPMNEVTQEVTLNPSAEPYVIMPATYEPKKLGPFMLSVAAEVDFDFRSEADAMRNQNFE
eukprot:GILK01002349.1.p1 GENE.GILK01002349.1~~GILK01002349.1.p1  ORF type:complete len:1020 (-),score=203.00 GILK01002349.1:103-3162(-)